METGLKVSSGDLSVLSALGGVPVHTGTDVEGVGQAVVRDVPGLGQSGGQLVQVIVLHQTVNRIHGDLGVRLRAGVQPVQRDRSGGERSGVSILQGVALLGQIGGGIIGALTGHSGSPQLHQILTFFLGDEFIGDDQAVQAVVVVAPLDIGDGTGSHTADGIVTALSGGGDHDSGVQQSGLGLGEENKSLVNGVGRILCGGEQLGILTQSLLVDVLIVLADINSLAVRPDGSLGLVAGLSISGVIVILDFNNRSVVVAIGRIVATASDQRENHGQCQQQCQQFLCVFHELASFVRIKH